MCRLRSCVVSSSLLTRLPHKLAERGSLPALAPLRAFVRETTSLWRRVSLYKRTPTEPYRLSKLLPRPTSPVRIEGIVGHPSVGGVPFKHAVALPDGSILPWFGRPHHDFVQFWREQLTLWAQRKAPPAYSCPRCDGVLERLPRPVGWDETFDEDHWRCETRECAIDAARVRLKSGTAIVEVVRGMRSHGKWSRLQKEAKRQAKRDAKRGDVGGEHQGLLGLPMGRRSTGAWERSRWISAPPRVMKSPPLPMSSHPLLRQQ